MDTDCPRGAECVLARAAHRRGPTARGRQLRWVATEIHRAGQRLPDPPVSCAGWLSPPHLDRYLAAAEAGQLRTRTSARVSPSPATSRVRHSCLRELAHLLRLPPPALPVGGTPDPDPAPRTDVARLLTHLSKDESPRGRRTTAAAALAACRVSVTDLADLRTGELSATSTGLAVTRSWARASTTGTRDTSTLLLPGWAAAPVEDWLPVRDQVAVSDRVPHLLLTCRPTHRGGAVYAAGLPVSARGLARAHQHALDGYYATLAARVGADPARAVARRLRMGNLQL